MRRLPRPGARRSGVLLLTSVALALTGAGATGWALTHQVAAPQPRASEAGPIDEGPIGAGPTATGRGSARSPHGLVLRPSPPVVLDIPAIGVHASLLRLGLTPDGSLDVPPPGPRYDDAAWFTGSPAPGSVGPAVIEGHVDSAADGPSVFFRLGELGPRDRVLVRRADGVTAVFTVDAARRYPKDAFPTGTVYGNTDVAALRLVTCGGSFDRSTGHYRDNVVVYAHLVGARRS